YLVTGKTDLRKGIDGLVAVVTDEFALDPFQNALFLFCGSRKDRFKGLLWDQDGFLLLYKRFENGRLQWPTNQAEMRQLRPKELRNLLQGWSLDATIHKYDPRSLQQTK
ncbi:IS66 family insertion sequence element accessory protein TnpB, partial [Ligilactobacillus salitolerans]|uniref:IS66 family insertion sequence element accessory protein TnpB n=1 Tax=Ligilactobacillus salitolerans TaxID=1808352 RepID=UPI0011CF7F3F